MGGFHGADTEALRAVGSAFSRRAENLEELAAQLAALIDAVDWVGTDADAFRSDWISSVRPGLHRCGARIGDDARELDAHADEQDLTSDPASDGGAAGSAGAEAAGAGMGGIAETASGAIGGAGLADVVFTDEAGGAHRIEYAAAAMPLARPVDGPAATALAAEASERIGSGQLQFTDTGMLLEPPATERTVEVGTGHELAPRAADAPFGIDADGAPIPLEASTKYEVGKHGTYYTDKDGEVVYVEATGGGKSMNPNLRAVFPDATYHVNESTYYQTDELGRTEHMYVPEVSIDKDMTRSQSIQSKIAERFEMDTPSGTETISYDAGHVLARQLGGVREEINYTRQWNDVNQARKGVDNIYAFESLMVNGIEKDHHSYSYETRANYGAQQPPGVGPDHGSKPWEYVPESYDVRIHENGTQIVEEHLANYPEGATFTEGKKK